MSTFKVTAHNGAFVVDTEYSLIDNQLISVAIVPLWPELTGHRVRQMAKPIACPEAEFYEVISPLPLNMNDFVKTNVVPNLGKEGIDFKEFQRKLQEFILENHIWHLHYDWCEDIALINRALVTGPGERLDFARRLMTHTHHANIEVESDIPHNALHDARAIAAQIRIRLMSENLS